MSLPRTILSFGLLILLFDGIWVSVYRAIGSGSVYWLGAVLTAVIYALAGMGAAVPARSLSDGASAGTAVGAIDASLGRLLGALMGGARLWDVGLWVVLLLSTAVGVALGALCGTVGAAAVRLAQSD